MAPSSSEAGKVATIIHGLPSSLGLLQPEREESAHPMSAFLGASTPSLHAGYGTACSLTSFTIHLHIWILSGAPLSFVPCMTSSLSRVYAL